MIGAAISGGNNRRALLGVLMLVGFLGGALAFSLSYFSNSNVLIGLCLTPFCLFFTGQGRNNIVYLTLCALCATISFLYGVRIFYFFTLAFYFLWLVELFVGRLNVLILFLIVFMSPFFIQVATILGFPIRLMLSASAGKLLTAVGADVQVQGNMMIADGGTFSVDEACMGLNMFAISMLMGVFTLAYRYRISGMVLGFCFCGIFFSLVFVLNMITNVIRIIILVYFRISPENPMHDFVGILCLVVYVAVPLHFLGGWFVRNYGRLKHQSRPGPVLNRSSIALMTILPLVVLSVGASVEQKRKDSGGSHASVQFGKATPEKMSDGITKISTSELLIYVKTIPEFFSGEHTPLMCWRGSGYEFSEVTTVTIGGILIYKGTLVKDEDRLHTAWWYSNGKVQTISQLEWRMKMLRGDDDFCIVNVTAKDDKVLMESIDSMLSANAIVIKT